MYERTIETEGSSPHTRGAPSRAASAPSKTADHPRIRGEHAIRSEYSIIVPGSSPHTRGAPYSGPHESIRDGIIPAYAGSTPSGTGRAGISRDHPRIRGEHAVATVKFIWEGGSSPHTRGAPPGGRGGVVSLRDHPRIRGEHMHVYPPVSRFDGSSPHTRGALYLKVHLLRCPRIIPAYAGSTSPAPAPSSAQSDHPRIRGEHIKISVTADTKRGSSPHTRGAPQEGAVHGLRARIIPAYAGSTAVGWRRRRRLADHPRIRGEHDARGGARDGRAGSSPHTRGAHRGRPAGAGRAWIIPAYAGST